jgi:DNA polymerase-3 subunit epsilon
VHSLNFTAIDFETANSKRGSVCAVGLTKVRAGAVMESQSWLIRPPAGIDHFDARNISVHGVRPQDVLGADSWETSLQRILDFAAGDALIAHNASFDRSVFRNACLESNLEVPEVEFHCSLELARRRLDLEVNRLPQVAKALGLSSFRHHDAGSDAETCANAVLAIARRDGLSTLELLWPARPTKSSGSHRYGSEPALAELPQPNPLADPSHPLFGQVVVFTGELLTLERPEAMTQVAHRGAVNAKNITKKTTMLIIGRQDPRSTRVEISTDSGKERKALQYIEAGQAIRPVSEKQLLEWLAPAAGAVGNPTEGAARAAAPARAAPPALEAPAVSPAALEASVPGSKGAPLEFVAAGVLRLLGSFRRSR